MLIGSNNRYVEFFSKNFYLKSDLMWFSCQLWLFETIFLDEIEQKKAMFIT